MTVLRLLIATLAVALLASCGGGRKVIRYEGPVVTQVQVQKSARQVHLLNGENVIKSYNIGLGFAPEGAKRFEGDGKTPEGIFYIDRRNPQSSYHLSLGISYPRPQDIAYAAQFGRSAGGDIFFHGQANDPYERANAEGKQDWTAGCIALTNEEMRELYTMVRVGTPVVIYP